jgi:hypothetical protein
MPQSCFSYSSDMPSGIGIPGGGGEMGPCFSYSHGMLPGDLRRMPEGTGCFSYQGAVPRPERGIQRMQIAHPCFSYYE